MAHNIDLQTTWADGNDWSGDVAQRVTRVLQNQALGAYQFFGNGVLSGFEVTDSGGITVDVAAGVGIATHSSKGAYKIETTVAVTNIALTDNATNYIWATVEVSTNDTRETATPAFVANLSSTNSNGIALATVTTLSGAITSIVDTREILSKLNGADTSLVVQDSGGIIAVKYGDGSTLGAGIGLGHAGGTKAAPTAVPDGHRLGLLYLLGHDGTAMRSIAQIVGRALGTLSGSNRGSVLDVETTPTGTTTRQKVGQFAVPFALTDAATIAVDASKGNLFRVTLGNNRTLGNPTNAYDGQILEFQIKQDGTGSRVLSLDTKYRFGTDITGVTLTTTANKMDRLFVEYHLADDKFDVVEFLKGF